MKTVLLTMALAFIAGLLLAVKTLMVRGGTFPSHHHNHHPARRQGQPKAAHATDTVKKS
ncbi:MAG: hypothetical protein K2H99_05295 [Paramuribaculum sp.]|nr:hypothetical protein [Paramuribaculum sp.]MDE5723584.1 hypothetical protein [Paramuribaculum sp.]